MDRNRLTITACTLLLLAVPGLATTIQLENGDRVTGQPYGVTDGKLALSTDSFGEIEVDLAKIVSIESEEPITVVLTSGDTLTGKVTREGENSIRITSGTGSIVTGMEDVANLAPAPEILAMGDGIEAEIEVLGAVAEENPWSGSIALGFSLFAGNNDRLGFNLTAQAVRETDDDRFQADLLIRYAEDQGERNTNEKIMVFRQDVKMGEEKDWYLFGQLYLENDEFEDLDLRAALSLGAGWVLSKAEDGYLNFDVAPTLTYEDYIGFDGEWTAELLVGLKGETRVFDNARLFGMLQFYPNLSDFGEGRVLFFLGIEQPLSESLNLRITFEDKFNSNPVPGTYRNDIKLLIAIGFNF